MELPVVRFVMLIKQLGIIAFFINFTLASCFVNAEEGNLSPTAKDETPTEESAPAPSSENQNESGGSQKKPRPKITKPVERFTLQQRDIKHYLGDDNVTALLAKTDEYLTLIAPYETEINKGVVILLPDWQKGATNPSAINHLRKQLPYDGWTTITVHPPAKPENYPSVLIDLEKRAEENEKSLTDYQEKLVTLMVEVMKKAEEYPGTFVVVAQGNTGAVLMNAFTKEQVKEPNALVLLSAYLPTDIENNAFSINMASSDLPVLDLHLKKDHKRALLSARQRAIKAKHELKTYYRQQEIFNSEFSYYPDASLRASILGWLRSIGW